MTSRGSFKPAAVGGFVTAEPMALMSLQSLSYLGVVSGDTGNLYIKALLRARKVSPSSLMDRVVVSEGEASRLLSTLHPEKSRVMGSQMPSLSTLVQRRTWSAASMSRCPSWTAAKC
ncbi:hypothetical protein FJV41_36555 [Myxococcus llanfairpwllgwyngyllgogerychwyrndrobwllllantysiliogogogochensis]|uniref:Uncharacterized protein n=1 Tax=Myxococcus llanfairpwllgwyngyllgogerychwyrndrobwllllantysiliogogogochensis TaxID=2590453 RepID=A0A540WPP2_9BACT|nr:hypothetical protein FJV41_36555 [Myxococcus llanfairpwllgwyngyllgogerychwyrndrobwllllantysiliogogogochensis]